MSKKDDLEIKGARGQQGKLRDISWPRNPFSVPGCLGALGLVLRRAPFIMNKLMRTYRNRFYRNL